MSGPPAGHCPRGLSPRGCALPTGSVPTSRSCPTLLPTASVWCPFVSASDKRAYRRQRDICGAFCRRPGAGLQREVSCPAWAPRGPEGRCGRARGQVPYAFCPVRRAAGSLSPVRLQNPRTRLLPQPRSAISQPDPARPVVAEGHQPSPGRAAAAVTPPICGGSPPWAPALRLWSPTRSRPAGRARLSPQAGRPATVTALPPVPSRRGLAVPLSRRSSCRGGR